MKTPFSRYLLFALFSVVLLSACDSEEPDDHGPGEEELITKVTITLQATGTNPTASAVATDPDGDGANFTIGTLEVVAGETYTGTITLEDELNGEDITEEVEEEADEHQFFYIPGGADGGRLTFTITDVDGNGLPVGLEYTAEVAGTDAGTATLRVVLGHYDEGPKNGTDMSDESDVDITFPVTIVAS